MRQEFCLNHSSGLNAQNILSRILDQARLTGGLPKPVFLAFLSVALICVSRARGERHVRRFFLSAYFGLQSTRPCGRDPRSGLPLQAAPYFNPRAPRGGRRAVDRISKRTAKFQSTRPRARGLKCRDGRAARRISQSRPTCGARLCLFTLA